MTTVVNIKYSEYDVYIGRAGHGLSGYYGNPHTMGTVYCNHCKSYHDRAGAFAAYKDDFYKKIKEDPEFKKRILELKDKKLGCFCKPLLCHGDIIADYLNNL